MDNSKYLGVIKNGNVTTQWENGVVSFIVSCDSFESVDITAPQYKNRKCKYCSQWGQARSECRYCGAPIDE